MITVPKTAFQEQDDGGAAIAPEVGDEVNLGGVTVRISADKGEDYDVDVTAVNGVPIAAKPEPKPAMSLRDQMVAEDEA